MEVKLHNAKELQQSTNMQKTNEINHSRNNCN